MFFAGPDDDRLLIERASEQGLLLVPMNIEKGMSRRMLNLG